MMSSRVKQTGLAVVLSLLLAGCQTATVKMAQSDQDFETRTAQAIETLTPIVVNLDAEKEIFLSGSEFSDEPSGVVLLQGGERSLARLYKLPTWTGPYSIQIRSTMLGTLDDPALFYPRATMLDSTFKPVRNTVQSSFKFRVGAQAAMVAADIWVNESDRKESYLLVTSEPRTTIAEQENPLQSQGSVVVPIPIGPVLFVWVVPTGGTELPKKMRAANSGPVQVRFRQLNARKILPDERIQSPHSR